MKISNFMKYHYLSGMSTCRYIQLLEHEEIVRRDCRVPRCVLWMYIYLTLIYLYSRGNIQALLNATGHDHCSFFFLLEKFKYTFDYHSVDKYTDVIYF